MRLVALIKRKLPWLTKIYSHISRLKFGFMTVVSPKWNTRARYKSVFGRNPDLDKPQTFHEKLIWLKLNKYSNDPLVIRCSDKYLVRDYVRECGCEELLNELLGCWDSPKEIPWDELPQKFVLKWNFGAGMNLICTDKTQIHKHDTIKKFQKWEKNKCWLSHAEMHYKYIKRKIVCEKYLEMPGIQVIPDYKVYCFHGKPQAILVMHGRGSKVETEFFDTEWVKLLNTSKYDEPFEASEKPTCLQHLLDSAEKLSQPFPFVRCDFYIINGKVYFGELTFTPAAGIYTSQTDIHGVDMADLIHIM